MVDTTATETSVRRPLPGLSAASPTVKEGACSSSGRCWWRWRARWKTRYFGGEPGDARPPAVQRHPPPEHCGTPGRPAGGLGPRNGGQGAALTLVLFFGWVLAAGKAPLLEEVRGAWLPGYGPAEVVGLALFVAAVAGTAAWMLQVTGLLLGLTGRPWLVAGLIVCGYGAFLGTTVCVSVYRAEVWRWGWPVLSWAAGGAVLLKLTATVWAGGAGLHRGLISPRLARTFAAAWGAGVLAVFGLALWLNQGGLVPWYLLGLGAVLAVPSAAGGRAAAAGARRGTAERTSSLREQGSARGASGLLSLPQPLDQSPGVRLRSRAPSPSPAPRPSSPPTLPAPRGPACRVARLWTPPSPSFRAWQPEQVSSSFCPWGASSALSGSGPPRRPDSAWNENTDVSSAVTTRRPPFRPAAESFRLSTNTAGEPTSLAWRKNEVSPDYPLRCTP